jgi:hypothetical protein
MPTTSPQIAGGAVVAVHRYRLVTGDTVRVLTRADGTSVPRVEGGTPFIWSGGREGLVVVPRTAPPLLRGIDPSLFDTSALARVTRNGRTPVVIRFTDPVRHAVPAGVHVVSGTARTAGGGTVVHATFGRHFAGFDQRDLRDIASVGLDAREPRASAEAATGPTHTVQFHVVNKRGAAAEFAMVTMQNTVDGMSYLEQVDVDDNGVAAFTDVPEGEYSAVVQTFQQVLVDRQFVVTADRTIEMNLGDATVRPHVTLRDHHPIWTDISVERDPEDGFGIPFGAAGPHFGFRVQPTPGHVRHGALRTGVTATLVQGRKANGYDDVALTADAGRGVPDDLTLVHHRREFASTATGRRRTGL